MSLKKWRRVAIPPRGKTHVYVTYYERALCGIPRKRLDERDCKFVSMDEGELEITCKTCFNLHSRDLYAEQCEKDEELMQEQVEEAEWPPRSRMDICRDCLVAGVSLDGTNYECPICHDEWTVYKAPVPEQEDD